MVEVVVICGHKRRQFELLEGDVTIGAASDNDWVIPYEGVSRHHAVARSDPGRPGRLILRDLGSTNRLLVGGERRSEVELEPGGEVCLGRAVLRLERSGSADPIVPLKSQGVSSQGLIRLLSSTSEVAFGPGDDGPRSIIAFVRELEAVGPMSGRRRHEALERLRRLLTAKCVLVAPLTRRDELVVNEIAGAMPSPRSLGALARRARSALPVEGDDGDTWLVARASRGDVALAALVPDELAPAEWRELSLICVADRLTALAPAAPEYEDGDGLEESVSHETLRFPPGMVVGTDPAFVALLDQLRPAIAYARSFLLLGETGVGKEPIARLIYHTTPEPRGPWVACNMAALPHELIDAELFGIEAGVATGVRARAGLFEQAQGGTVFLDEIGELPLEVQSKLLRTLQEREIRRVGSTTSKALQVRIVAASNRDLARQVHDERFRADLFYRLNQITCRVPSLRERRGDIPPLALAFAARFAGSMGKRVRGIHASALVWLQGLPWPGNVRQLEHAIEAAVMSCASGAALRREDFPRDLERGGPPADGIVAASSPMQSAPTFQEQRAEVERREVLDAIRRAGGRLNEAAKLLGMTAAGLRAKRRRLGLR